MKPLKSAQRKKEPHRQKEQQKEKCIFYDNKFAYIFDIAHTACKGSKLINDLIIKETEQIETKQFKR